MKTAIKYLILGGGGHARVIIDCLQDLGLHHSAAILDQDPTRWDQELMGVPIVGGDEQLPQLVAAGVTHFIVGLGGTGDNGPRRRLFELGIKHGLSPLDIRHPTAFVSKYASLGAGTVVFPHAVVNAGASVGRNVIINTGAIIEHDCVIGDHVHLATGSLLCSTVSVGNESHIGAGATIRQYLSIGDRAVVGAGAVVVKDVNAYSVVAGVPAKVLAVRRGDARRD